jgi:hypothetical protein
MLAIFTFRPEFEPPWTGFPRNVTTLGGSTDHGAASGQRSAVASGGKWGHEAATAQMERALRVEGWL